MFVEKIVKILHFFFRDVTAGLLEMPFTVHEIARILADLFANSWMFLQKFLQLRVGCQISGIVDKGRVLLQVFIDCRMIIEESIKIVELLMSDIGILLSRKCRLHQQSGEK